MEIVFGNKSNRTKYTIYYLLKGDKKHRVFISHNKDNIKKVYKKILSKQVTLMEVFSDPTGIWRHRIAYHCPKYFIDHNDFIREKGSELLDFDRKQEG